MTDIFPFVVGHPRSGTTLLRSMLDSHPQVAIPSETYFIVRMAHRRRAYERTEGFAIDAFLADLQRAAGFQKMGVSVDAVRGALTDPPNGHYSEAIRRVFRLYAQQNGKERYGDKTPVYVLHIPLLAELFPEARFIHIVRDGRDVALSFVDGGWARRLEDAALVWKLHVTRGRRYGERLGAGRYLEVRYENLVANPGRELQMICDFIDLPFAAEMLDYRRSGARWVAEMANPASHRRVLLPPTPSLRDWRVQMSPRDVTVLEALAGDLFRELGYELASERMSAGPRLDAVHRWLAWQTRRAGRRALSAARSVVAR